MLQIVMNHVPNEWKREENYTNKLYSLHEVDLNSCEVFNLKNSFSKPVSKIIRLQNPYMYGRYLLRKESQIFSENTEIAEEFKYHLLNRKDKDIVCEYGCDYRRYNHLLDKQKNSDNENTPKFFNKNDTALINNINIDEEIIVAVKVLRSKPYYDNDYYPQYFIYFKD